MLEMTDEVIEVQKDTKLDGIEYTEIKDPYGFIYITTNLINGKRYLGQKKFDRKWKEYIGSGRVFKAAVKKYGRENFARNIVCICYSADELNAIEYELSVWFNVVESDCWYNLVYGGGTTTGIVVSEDTRAKLSEARRNNTIVHPEYDEYHGRKMVEFYENNPDAKKKISDRMFQLWQDPDYAARISQSMKFYWEDDDRRIQQSIMMKEVWKDPCVRDARLSGLKEWAENPDNHDARSQISKNNWNKPEYRENQIAIHSGKNNSMYGVHRYGIDSPKYIPVYCIELDSIFWGAKQAGSELSISKSDIARCCKKIPGHCSAGKHPITKDRLHWLYADDAIDQGYITQQNLEDYLDSLRKGNDINGKTVQN